MLFPQIDVHPRIAGHGYRLANLDYSSRYARHPNQFDVIRNLAADKFPKHLWRTRCRLQPLLHESVFHLWCANELNDGAADTAPMANATNTDALMVMAVRYRAL